MIRSDKLCRWGYFISAALVGVLALTSNARAVQNVLTPNAAIVGYTLAAGASSGGFSLPANESVLVMGVCTTSGDRGIGHVSLLRVPGTFVEWVGLNSPSAATVTSGFSGTTGTNIVQIDFSGGVFIQVNAPDSIRVTNSSTTSRIGSLTMIW